MRTTFQKPAKLDRCVAHLLADPNFKPKVKGQTKEQAAWAVCQSSLAKVIENIQEAVKILKDFEDNDEETSTEGGIL